MKFKKSCLLLSLALVSSLTVTSPADAHGGRTNSSGCHNDNVNGGYHCHNGGGSSGTGSGSSGTGSGSSTPPTPICRTETQNFYFATLEKYYTTVREGRVENYSSNPSVLNKKAGTLVQFFIKTSSSSFLVKRFDYNNPSLGSYFSFSGDSSWSQLTDVEILPFSGFEAKIKNNNSFGIDKVRFEKKEETRQVCQ